jgi:Phosphotransferase enzyme family
VQALGEQGLRLAGEIEQPHVRPWSTVLRVPTAEGDVWFKAAVPSLSHDIGVTSTLAGLRRDLVLAPLAIDLERRWMLLPDGGERLREVLGRERHPRRWLELAPLYAQLQSAAVPAVDELLGLGTPDYRLGRLPELSDELGAALGRRGPGPERVTELAGELAALGIPETIQHDDLHDGNVFVHEGGYWIFDWGDSCISHPFMSLVVGLRGIAHTFELAEHDPDLERIRDAYLEAWSERASRPELLRAVEIADCFGRLSRALGWWRWAVDVGPAGRGEPSESATGWFEEFAAAAG